MELVAHGAGRARVVLVTICRFIACCDSASRRSPPAHPDAGRPELHTARGDRSSRPLDCGLWIAASGRNPWIA